uniref:Uncharacterized protein n=1 Tax=Timema cristinae TaxID=61476 RepID=A0A7R9CY84_TIMCR|nr:unnamed protein product [Timema cristinae]
MSRCESWGAGPGNMSRCERWGAGPGNMSRVAAKRANRKRSYLCREYSGEIVIDSSKNKKCGVTQAVERRVWLAPSAQHLESSAHTSHNGSNHTRSMVVGNDDDSSDDGSSYHEDDLDSSDEEEEGGDGVESVDWDISSLLCHTYYLLTDSTARRALFTQLTGVQQVLWCAVALVFLRIQDLEKAREYSDRSSFGHVIANASIMDMSQGDTT